MPLIEAGVAAAIGGIVVKAVDAWTERGKSKVSAQAQLEVAKTNAQALIDAKETVDATLHDAEIARQLKEYIENLRTDNSSLRTLCNDLQKQIDEVRNELLAAQKSIADNYKLIKTQEQQIEHLTLKEQMAQQEHQDEITRLHDREVELMKRLNDSQAWAQSLSLRLANCKCQPGGGRVVEVHGETVNVTMDSTEKIGEVVTS